MGFDSCSDSVKLLRLTVALLCVTLGATTSSLFCGQILDGAKDIKSNAVRHFVASQQQKHC